MGGATDKLTDTATRQAKPRPKPFKLADGGGLFLLVRPDGKKYWRLAYRHDGKQQLLAIGVYPEVSLKEARIKRDAARKHIANDIDSGELKRSQKAVMHAFRVRCALHVSLSRSRAAPTDTSAPAP